MTTGANTWCARCHAKVSLVLGFSAPMTMPGQEEPACVSVVKLLDPVSDDQSFQL